MYDCVFVTHIPSFYKINLFNEISRKLNIFVVFIADKSKIRAQDFLNSEKKFEFITIRSSNLESRICIKELITTVKIFKRLEYKMIIVGGWEHVEFWVPLFINKQKKTGLILESTYIESSINGFKGIIKKIFLSRISIVFASGEPHKQLLKELSYKGQIKIANGVGLFNRGYRKKRLRKEKRPQKFLFVGRLAKEKNIEFLVKYFNRHPEKQLTIVGDGPLRESLFEASKDNLYYLGYQNNLDLYNIYLEHDIFILPSLSEPWGLVVEEALFYGLPVLVSKKCGCHGQAYKEGYEGLSFNPEDMSDFEHVENVLEKRYQWFSENVSKIDFDLREKLQVLSYLEGINENIISS